MEGAGPVVEPLLSSASLPTTVAEKIATAVRHKEAGNAFFKEGKYSKAKVQYCTALAYTKGLPGRKDAVADPLTQHIVESRAQKPLSAEENEALSELDCTLKTNAAVCFLKMNKPTEALQFAKEALLLRPTSWKALLRKGEAQMMLKQHSSAIKTLDDALLHNPDPGNRVAVMSVRSKVVEQLKKEEAEQKKAFKNIFDRARQGEEK